MRSTVVHLFARLGSSAFIVFLLSAPSFTSAQVLCEQELRKAEAKYFDAEYDAAIALINDCLSHTGLPAPTLKRAYKWMALVYIAKGDSARARVNVGRLLTLDLNYQPDPGEDLPEEFLEMVTKEKQRLEAEKRQREEAERQRNLPPSKEPKKKGSSKKWLWIGVGVGGVTTGVVLAIISNPPGGSSLEPEKLSDPPPPPGN